MNKSTSIGPYSKRCSFWPSIRQSRCECSIIIYGNFSGKPLASFQTIDWNCVVLASITKYFLSRLTKLNGPSYSGFKSVRTLLTHKFIQVSRVVPEQKLIIEQHTRLCRFERAKMVSMFCDKRFCYDFSVERIRKVPLVYLNGFFQRLSFVLLVWILNRIAAFKVQWNRSLVCRLLGDGRHSNWLPN